MPNSAEALKPLLTTAGFQLLNSLPAYTETAAAQINKQLRHQGWDPETVAAVLTQLRLRRDAQTKFADFASEMLFTHEGLQQATRLPVAALHAQRFHQAGIKHVADLGCGLGADAMAFASASMAVTAVEADETAAAAATVNLSAFPEAQVLHTTAEQYAEDHHFTAGGQPPTARGLWLDPARRRTGPGRSPSRIWDPEDFSPPLSFITSLAATGTPMGVKLGPGIDHDAVPDECEAQWVSIDGELVEVTLWFGPLARIGVRRAATALTGSAADPLRVTSAELTSSADFGQGPAPAPAGHSGLVGVLCEPDPAVIRAGLVADAAEALGGRMLDERIAYFCTDEPPSGPLAPLVRSYRIDEVMDFSTKALKRWCAERQVTSLEIKKRGVDVVPETLRRQVLPKRRPGPKRHATVVITRIGDRRVVAAVEPLKPASVVR